MKLTYHNPEYLKKVMISLNVRDRELLKDAIQKEWNKIKSPTHQYMLASDIIRAGANIGLTLK